jgi:hypothetical protein
MLPKIRKIGRFSSSSPNLPLQSGKVCGEFIGHFGASSAHHRIPPQKAPLNAPKHGGKSRNAVFVARIFGINKSTSFSHKTQA